MSVPYDDLDPGIRETVRFFTGLGFRTSDSGDGVSKVGGPHESCMMAPGLPNVTICCEPMDLVSFADSLLAELSKVGINPGPDEATVTELAGPQPEGTEYGDGVLIEATYIPESKSAFILVTGLDDAMLAAKRT